MQLWLLRAKSARTTKQCKMKYVNWSWVHCRRRPMPENVQDSWPEFGRFQPSGSALHTDYLRLKVLKLVIYLFNGLIGSIIHYELHCTKLTTHIAIRHGVRAAISLLQFWQKTELLKSCLCIGKKSKLYGVFNLLEVAIYILRQWLVIFPQTTLRRNEQCRTFICND